MTPTIHRRIFDSITKIDDSAAIISLNQVHVTYIKDISSRVEYKNTLNNYLTGKIRVKS